MSGEERTSTTPPAFAVEWFAWEGGLAADRLLLGGPLWAAAAGGLGFAAGWGLQWLPLFEYVSFALATVAVGFITWLWIGWMKLRQRGIAGVLAAVVAGVLAAAFHLGWCQWGLPQARQEIDEALPRYLLSLMPPAKDRPNVRLTSAQEKALLPQPIRAAIRPILEAEVAAGVYDDFFASFLNEWRRRGKPRRGVEGVEFLPLSQPNWTPAFRKALTQALDDFSCFDAWRRRAEQGVKLVLPRVHRPIQLGEGATYTLWSGELLVAVLVLVLTARRRASRPYCAGCNRWKPFEPLGRLHLSVETAGAILLSGRLLDIADHHLAMEGGQSDVAMAACPDCGEESDVELILSAVSKPAKGQEQMSEMLRVTYPGAALRVLRALFKRPGAA